MLRSRVFAAVRRGQRRSVWTPPPSQQQQQQQRIDRLATRMSGRMAKYVARVREMPASFVAAFLILHEITAIVPIVGLSLLFHYTTLMPTGYITEYCSGSMYTGVRMFERWFARREWFGFTKKDLEGAGGEEETERAMERWHDGEQKYRIVVEVAMAWAVTKALLPVRLMASFWAAPWFAGVLVKVKRLLW